MKYGAIVYKTNKEYHDWETLEDLLLPLIAAKPRAIGSITKMIKKYCGTTAKNVSNYLDVTAFIKQKSLDTITGSKIIISNNEKILSKGSSHTSVDFDTIIVYEETDDGVLYPVILNYITDGASCGIGDTVTINAKYSELHPHTAFVNADCVRVNHHTIKKWFTKIFNK